MKKIQFPANALVVGVLMGAVWVIPAEARATSPRNRTSNTAVNKRARVARQNSPAKELLKRDDAEYISSAGKAYPAAVMTARR
jgi:hypothetical protein